MRVWIIFENGYAQYNSDNDMCRNNYSVASSKCITLWGNFSISSLESSLNISKVMQPVNAREKMRVEISTNNKPQEETLSENMINNKPIVVAGPDQTVKSGDRVDLDGTES